MEKVFFRLDGVRGASKAPRHINEIEIHSYSWAVQSSPKSSNGGAGGKEKAAVNDLTIYKPTDNTSSILKLAAGDGRIFSSGKITLEKLSPTGGVLRSVVVNMESIVVASFSMSGATDIIGINFQKVFMEDPNAPKSKDSSPHGQWDLGEGRGA